MSDAFEPRAFFEVLLPAMLRDKGALASKVAAKVQLYLKGDDEDGCWTLDLRGEPSLVEGLDDEADLHLGFAEGAILPLLAGTLDVKAALASDDLEVHGDRAVLSRLAELFEGARSSLSLRLAAMTGKLG